MQLGSLTSAADWTRALLRDPRHYQLSVLSSLILIGLFAYSFRLPWWHVVGCVGATLVTQALADRFVAKRPFDPRSPLISALSLTLLLRTGSVSLSILAGVIAVGSKYILRWRGKHIFNPANFGLVIVSLIFSAAWISPGQWGAAPVLAVLLLGLGGIVTGKAKRWDVSLALLASYAALLFGRAIWLGDPLAIPVHQLQSGALLIFAFFMISDPKTTPDARAGRVLFAALVATVGFAIQFGLHNSAGIILALILCAPLVPLIDHLFRGTRYAWPQFFPTKAIPSKTGPSHDFTPAE
jgi:Na+-transporting NADH:ubiquinone oxidoreductase subunit NqrB